MFGPRREKILLLVVLAGALALRLWRLDADLPDFVEEAIPFRRALEMGGWQTGMPDLNPRFFNYPSLVIYIHLALIRVQMVAGLVLDQLAAADFWLRCQYDPTTPVLAARGVSILADLATAAGVWRLTRRHGWLAASLAAATVAVAGPMVRTGRLIQVDPIQAALTIWAVERMTAWRADGSRRQLVWSMILVGLAAGAKYQGALLLLPLAWVLWSRDGVAGLRRWPLLAVGSFVVFLATTPYAVIDPSVFWRDLRFEVVHISSGHFGSSHGGSIGFVLRTLVTGLGPVLALAAVTGLGAPLWNRRRPDPDEITLWAALLPLLMAVALSEVQSERYLVPAIPLLAVAAAAGLGALLNWRPVHGHTWALSLVALAALVPPLLSTLPGLPPAEGHDQVRARRWLEANVAPDDLVISESYTGRLRSVTSDQAVQSHPAWPQTSAAARRAFVALPRWRNIDLPLRVSGEVQLTVTNLDGEPEQLDIVSRAADLNAVFYATALLRDVTWVQTSRSIRSRHEADPGRYPQQLAWYRFLDANSEPAAVFAGGIGTAVTIYRLNQESQQLRRTLDPLWWTNAVSASFRRDFEACCVPPDARTGGAKLDDRGRLAAWVKVLRSYFELHVAQFLFTLGNEHAQTGHLDAARQALMPVMLVAPQSEAPLLLLVAVCRGQGDLNAVDVLLSRSLRACEILQTDPTLVLLLQAELCLDQGRPDEARRLATEVLRDPRTNNERRQRARRFIEALDREQQP